MLKDLIEEAPKSATTKEEQTSLRDCRNALKARLYATAASGIRQLLSRDQLRRHLTEAFDTARLERLTLEQRQRMLTRMENLVVSPWAGIITTNFDTLIENAFDRCDQASSPFRCDGDQDALGNVLCLPVGAGGFFVKLHGDTWADSQVLSTADYVQAWISTSKIRHFLTAIMLRYRLVFIGCSLEDEILRLRQSLWADFGKALPRAYALLPATPANRLRRRELKDDSGLESLLYDVKGRGDRHETVDAFLREARYCADLRKGEPSIGTLGVLQSRSLEERIEAVGAINRHLLALLSRHADARLEYANVFDPYFEQVPQEKSRHVLSALSEGERLYRLLFLVSLQLVEEQTDHGTQHFQLSPELRAHLANTPLKEE